MASTGVPTATNTVPPPTMGYETGPPTETDHASWSGEATASFGWAPSWAGSMSKAGASLGPLLVEAPPVLELPLVELLPVEETPLEELPPVVEPPLLPDPVPVPVPVPVPDVELEPGLPVLPLVLDAGLDVDDPLLVLDAGLDVDDALLVPRLVVELRAVPLPPWAVTQSGRRAPV